MVSLYDEDHELWEYLQQWRVPTREIIEDTPDNVMPIPMGYANGLGRLQTQHSCILLMDVTEHCNLNCPTLLRARARTWADTPACRTSSARSTRRSSARAARSTS